MREGEPSHRAHARCHLLTKVMRSPSRFFARSLRLADAACVCPQSTFLNVLSSKATYGMMTGEVEVVEVAESTDLDAIARRMSIKRVKTSPVDDPSPGDSQSQSAISVGSPSAWPASRRGGGKKPLGLKAIRLDMGYVPQDDTVHDELTVIENLRFRWVRVPPEAALSGTELMNQPNLIRTLTHARTS